jgi:ESCRT-II complex subunit VPS36
MEVAQEEGITVGLAVEMIGAMEGDGYVCRDDGSAVIRGRGTELRWWPNVLMGYVWDGQE